MIEFKSYEDYHRFQFTASNDKYINKYNDNLRLITLLINGYGTYHCPMCPFMISWSCLRHDLVWNAINAIISRSD